VVGATPPYKIEGNDMPYARRGRFGLWLERFEWLHPVLLRYDGETPDGRGRYINQVNRYVVVK
jgi:hypothetical protein